MPDREEVEKIKKELIDLISKADLSMPPSWCFTTIAEFIFANYVPRSEHEQLSRAYDKRRKR